MFAYGVRVLLGFTFSGSCFTCCLGDWFMHIVLEGVVCLWVCGSLLVLCLILGLFCNFIVFWYVGVSSLFLLGCLVRRFACACCLLLIVFVCLIVVWFGLAY